MTQIGQITRTHTHTHTVCVVYPSDTARSWQWKAFLPVERSVVGQLPSCLTSPRVLALWRKSTESSCVMWQESTVSTSERYTPHAPQPQVPGKSVSAFLCVYVSSSVLSLLYPLLLPYVNNA